MRIADISKLNFQLVSQEPILLPPKFTPLLADPTVLTPEESPDGEWYLWAHTAFGVTQYISLDGVQWKKQRIVQRAAMRPFIFREDDTYYLFYEKYNGLKLALSPILKSKWYSQIEMRSSKDLQQWTSPKVLITPSKDFHRDATLGNSVSNPCLVKVEGKYRLYFSSSLVRVPDCGFNEPLHISFAESDRIDGDYVCHDRPVFSPSADRPWCNIGAGSMKVLKLDDGYVSFQNGIYEHYGVSGSAICLLYSDDGITWKYLKEEPILKPDPVNTWMASHIYACDIKCYAGKWHLYFNARNHPHWSKGSEKIGQAVAELN